MSAANLEAVIGLSLVSSDRSYLGRIGAIDPKQSFECTLTTTEMQRLQLSVAARDLLDTAP